MGNKELGFTLVELALVIVVLAILAFTMVPRYTKLAEQSAAAVVQFTAANFKESVKMASLKWQAAGRPIDTFIDLDSNPQTQDDRVCFKADNLYPQSVTCPVPDSFQLSISECAGLFIALLENSTFPADVLVNENKCVFVYDNSNPLLNSSAGRLDVNPNKTASETPRFEYVPETGAVNLFK